MRLYGVTSVSLVISTLPDQGSGLGSIPGDRSLCYIQYNSGEPSLIKLVLNNCQHYQEMKGSK